MFTTPIKQHYMAIVPPKRAGYDSTTKIPKYYKFSDQKLNKETQRGSGLLEFIKKTFKPMANIDAVVKAATTGKIPTAVKTAWNKRKGFPSAFPGELHPMSKTNRGIAFNSYLGPSTQALKRLVRGDKPISRSDKAGQAHDIRFGLQSRNPKIAIRQMRSADKKFISKLKDLEKRGEPKFNTRVGIRGIQFKNKMEDLGIWPRTKFHTPWRKTQPGHPGIEIAENKLKELKQEGYGKNIPGEKLRKKILRDLKKKKFEKLKGGGYNKVKNLGLPRKSKKGGRRTRKPYPLMFKPKIPIPPRLPIKPGMIRPIKIPNIIIKKIVPALIKRVAKRLRMKPKQMGKGLKHEMLKFLKVKTKKIFERKKGGAIGIGTIIGIASAIAPLIPLGIEAGKFIIPKIIKLFTKKKKKVGKGIPKMFGNLLAAVMKKIAKSGPGKAVQAFIGKAGQKLVGAISKIIKAVPGVIKKIPKPIRQIANPVIKEAIKIGGPTVSKNIGALMKLLKK
jgi:hypothetical protein